MVSVRSGRGVSVAGAGGAFFFCSCFFPAGTGTSTVCPGWSGSATRSTTVPSVVVTTVRSPSLSTWNAVPRTEAVLAGVFTSYLELPAMSLVTTCQVRPTFCCITTTVLPSDSEDAVSILSSLFGSMLTVEPSKYVRTARAPSAVRIVPPAARTSPSVALTKAPVALCRTWTSPEMIETVVAAPSARPPRVPLAARVMNATNARTQSPAAVLRRAGFMKPPIRTTPAGFPVLTTASEPIDAPSPAHLPFGGAARRRAAAGGTTRATRVLIARRRVLRKSDEERPRATGLDREWLGESGLREDGDAQTMESLGAPLPLRSAHGTDESTVGHPLAVRQQDLRAASFDVRLTAVGGREIRERRLRPDAGAPREDPSIAAPVGVVVRFLPLGGALRAAEGSLRLVEAAPLDDPVFAAVGQDHALLHPSPRSSQH